MNTKGTLLISNLKGINEFEGEAVKLFTAVLPIKDYKKYGLVHIPKLGPSKGLLFRYKQEKIDWKGYVLEYRKLMLNMKSYLNRIEELLTSGENVMLVCYCSSKQCHNQLLASYFKELGFRTKQIIN